MTQDVVGFQMGSAPIVCRACFLPTVTEQERDDFYQVSISDPDAKEIKCAICQLPLTWADPKVAKEKLAMLLNIIEGSTQQATVLLRRVK